MNKDDEKLASESVGKTMNDFDEAAAVAYTDVKTPNGFYWAFTLRAENGNALVEKMSKFEEFCKLTHWEPQDRRKNGFKKEEKPIVYADHPCPICGSKVVVKETSKGKVENCETQKYDWKTKTTSGCAYVKWL